MPLSAGSWPVTTLVGDGTRRHSGHRLPHRARKSMVVVHVVVSVSWLALMLCLLTLGASALATDNADTLRTAYRAMEMLGDVLRGRADLWRERLSRQVGRTLPTKRARSPQTPLARPPPER